MFGGVGFDQNMVTSVDWQSYPVMPIDSIPEAMEIVLIKRPEAAPSGAAEMALGLVPAAIGNAVFDATGVRLRRVRSRRSGSRRRWNALNRQDDRHAPPG